MKGNLMMKKTARERNVSIFESDGTVESGDHKMADRPERTF